MHRLRRKVAFVTDCHHLIARADGEENFGRAREQGHDFHAARRSLNRNFEQEATEGTERQEGNGGQLSSLCYLRFLLFNFLLLIWPNHDLASDFSAAFFA